MSEEEALWADELLARVRGAVEPHSEDAARNLSRIEARLGAGALEPSSEAEGGAISTHDASEPPVPTPSATRPSMADPGEPASRQGPALGALANAGARIDASSVSTRWGGLASPLRFGLVLAFGLVTGVVGYLIGRTETQHEARENTHPSRVTSGVDPASERIPSASASSVSASSASSSRAPAATAQPDDSAARTLADTSRESSSGSSSSSAIGKARVARRAKRPASSSGSGAAAAMPAAPAASTAESDAFDLREALELLRRAEAALRRADGLQARMWLDDLDRRAPAQLLLEERLVTRTLAECTLGDVAAARQTLRQLEQANPESIYRARLEGSCVAGLVPHR